MDNIAVRPKILHVDNDREFLDIYAATFSRWFRIISVDTGDKALEVLKREDVECIITDYDMPGMNGIQLLWEIKQLHPRLPVIFFTGQGNEQVAREAFVLGASDYFTKDFYGPAATEKLINSIKTLVEKHQVEKALFDSQEIYRTIFDTASTAMIIVEDDSTIFLANNTFAKLSGYSKNEIEGKLKWQIFIHPDDLNTMEHFFTERLNNPASIPANYECRAFSRSGKLHHIYVTVSIIPATKRRVISWLDITSQKESEHARNESESRISAIFDTAVDSIFIKDTDFRFTQVNRAMAELFGMKQDDFIGKTDFDLFEPDEARINREIDRQVLAGEIIGREQTRTINGNVYTLHIIKSPMRDINGRITGLCGIARDVTQRKMFEEDLRNQKDLLSNIISHIPHFVFWKDRNSRFLGCNQNLATVAGMENPDQLVGKTDYDMPWKKEESDYYVECDRKVMETGIPILNLEEPQLQADGKEATLLTSKVPLKNSDGCVIGILGIFADITERKKMEATFNESQRRFRSIIDSISDYLFITDKDMHFIDCSKSFATAFSLNGINNYEGKNVFSLFPDFLSNLREKYNEAIKSGQTVVIVDSDKIPEKSGLAEIKIIPVKNADGLVERIVTAIRIISTEPVLTADS